ncbi:phosphoprotein associated with glycosphingolipid-enriched microdomains 1 [Amia ocellicauda]|uniref:phosphoprotein associated with glycosphingolipid-enriched microdomains 1 n=1 Tax=Amia ocellicauda TaxID=2972642 RepID=UPI003464E7A2
MAPLLSNVIGAGAGVLGIGHVVAVGFMTAVFAVLLLSLLVLLCASCQGQKKNNGPVGDHENLMNGVSERERPSNSAESPGTDMVASSSHNGPLTSGTVLSEDTEDNSPLPSEEGVSDLPEAQNSLGKSLKCHQDRELPRIPPNSTLEAAVPAGTTGTTMDTTYEVVKESTSQDANIEDSLYETVKEIKDQGLLSNKCPAPKDDPTTHLSLSPGMPNGVPGAVAAEYASIDRNRKSRHSPNSEHLCRTVEQVEEQPPPIPDKALDENENQQAPETEGAGLQNGEPDKGKLSLSQEEISAMYSTVVKPSIRRSDPGYNSIGEINRSRPLSMSSDLYATVKDVHKEPGSEDPPASEDSAAENVDPAYETIGILTQGGKRTESDAEVSAGAQREPDYESVGDLQLSRQCSRL